MPKHAAASYENDKDFIAAQRRFLEVAVGLGVLSALVAALIQFRSAEYGVAAQSLIFPILAPLLLLYQRRSVENYRRGLTLFALLVLAGQSMTTQLGLKDVVDLSWYAIYPLAYFFLLGPLRGLRWSLAGLGVTVALYSAAPLFYGHYLVDALTFLMAMLAYGLSTTLSWFHTYVVDAYQRRLYMRVNYDHLTGVLSRVGGIELLRRYVNLANRDADHLLTVVSFDLDDFKRVNDTYGHDVGDRVLRAVAVAVTSGMRKSDCLIRWGGEEFLLLLPGSSAEHTRQLAEKLRNIVGAATRDMLPKQVTASVGVTNYRRNESIASLLKRVDDLMYAAKRAGKNTVVHELADSDPISGELHSESI